MVTFVWFAQDVLPLRHVAFGGLAALVSPDFAVDALALTPQFSFLLRLLP